MAESAPVGLNRIERVLAFMIASTAGLSFVAIVAVLIAQLTGGEIAGGVWPVVLILPLIGLPMAFLLIIALLVFGVVRRRAGRDGGS